MPRPRRDSEILPAKDRLENAFWGLLKDREYHRITVTDVVHTAEVNRNSFYYHFSGLPELADSAILHEVEDLPVPHLPQVGVDPEEMWRDYCNRLFHDPVQRERLDRIGLLTGPHSSPELHDALRDFLRMSILSSLGLDMDTMDVKTLMLMHFTIGGLLSVMEAWNEVKSRPQIDEMMSEDIAVIAMGIYFSMTQENMDSFWRHMFNSPRPARTKYAMARMTV